MNQLYENVLELENFDIEEISQENEFDELLGDLNARYFEEVIKLKDAKNMIFSHSGNNGSLFNILSVY
ncbi:MAG: hypothetical protein KAX18_00185 [Candidatus Lokiarchaeota archaeon]|nr:hypothetical protein [Candidatus Lokiarchaeota archaeon]